MARLLRAETLDRVLEQLDRGRSYAEVARTLGYSRSWVSELLSDPDAGARAAAARKLAHAGSCEDCGRAFRALAHSTPGRRCARCRQRADTRARLEAELRDLATRLGHTPHVDDAPKLVRRAQHSHGSWASALKAAGLKPRAPGRPAAKRKERG